MEWVYIFAVVLLAFIFLEFITKFPKDFEKKFFNLLMKVAVGIFILTLIISYLDEDGLGLVIRDFSNLVLYPALFALSLGYVCKSIYSYIKNTNRASLYFMWAILLTSATLLSFTMINLMFDNGLPESVYEISEINSQI